MVNVFAAPVFFICFRECLETVVVVSVLLSLLKQTVAKETHSKTYYSLRKQIWLGVSIGLIICVVIGVGMIGAFYALDKNVFASTEDIWEGVFSLIASIIISIMGAALLRVSKLQDKWRRKLIIAMEKQQSGTKTSSGTKQWSKDHALFILPFVTVLREGLEAVVFIGGVGLSFPASAFPLPVILGVGAGILVGYFIYRGGNSISLQVFLSISVCFLYLVAAGLFSRSVWYFENYKWNQLVGGDASESGAGPGSYDIRQSVWHVNCCSPKVGGGGGWGVFNSLFGWQNSATYGSVISYNLYWLVVIITFLTMSYNEKYGGFGKGQKSNLSDSAGDSKLDVVAAPAERPSDSDENDLKMTPFVTKAREPTPSP